MPTPDPEFIGVMSSDDIWYAGEVNIHLTDVIDEKSDIGHTHSEYATVSHAHSGYASSTHTHSEYALSTHTHDGYALSTHTHSDKADLVDGMVPASQLPSYVDDVLEYTALASFPNAGESGKIYIDQSTNKTYRWSGSAYVEISASLALGETASTAYRGDRGATAYTHSQNGDVHVTAAQKTAWDAKSNFSGSYNDLSDKPIIPSAYTHPTSHPASMITGLADVATSGNYNDLSNTPTIPTIPTSLPANGGNADTVDNKHASDFAAASHAHSYNDLSDKPTIPSAYTHPTSHPASMITGLATVATSGSYNDLSNKPTIPSAYTHPSYTAKSSGLYKVTVDATGHVSGATAVTKADITALGIPASDTNTTYSAATTSAAGLMSATDKSKLDGIASGANAYTLPAAGSALGGVKTGGDVTISSGTITVNDDSHNHVISNIDNLQTTLDGKASSSHTHTAAALVQMASVLFGTNSGGGVEYSYGSDSGKNVLTEISNMSQGFHTAYAISGTTGNPRTTESFRFLIHKTSGVIGWILAWDAQGSIFTNYQSAANTFKGWKCLYDASPTSMILWSGSAYMQSTNSTPQVVIPSKKLSQCRTGWMLLWSDYDPGDGANDSDFCTTFIPKFTPSGGTWGGKAFYCDIPMYVGSDATDLSTEKRCIKPIYVHDDCLKGSYQNTSGGRNDVVLRAVYEV